MTHLVEAWPGAPASVKALVRKLNRARTARDALGIACTCCTRAEEATRAGLPELADWLMLASAAAALALNLIDQALVHLGIKVMDSHE